MQFQVPQFIDIEDKVIGPFTIKQFLYLLCAGIIVFILSKLLSIFATIVLAIPIVGIAVCLAFIKVHGQPFMIVLKNFFSFLQKPDFYIWKKPVGKNQPSEQIEDIEIVKKAPAKTKIKPEAKDNLQDIGWKAETNKEEE